MQFIINIFVFYYHIYYYIIADLILAGNDTTAVMLTWAIVLLCHYPAVQKKISAELDQFIHTHKRLPTFEERESLPYSISVQKECMRFRPTLAFGISHEAERDCKFFYVHLT